MGQEACAKEKAFLGRLKKTQWFNNVKKILHWKTTCCERALPSAYGQEANLDATLVESVDANAREIGREPSLLCPGKCPLLAVWVERLSGIDIC